MSIVDQWETSQEIEENIGSYIDFASVHTTIHDLGVRYFIEERVDTIEEGFAKAENEVDKYLNDNRFISE